jgi:hypothetical protein
MGQPTAGPAGERDIPLHSRCGRDFRCLHQPRRDQRRSERCGVTGRHPAHARLDVPGRLGEQGRHRLCRAPARRRRPPGPGRGCQRDPDLVAAAAGPGMAARRHGPGPARPHGGRERQLGRGDRPGRAGSRLARDPGRNRRRSAGRAGSIARPDLGIFRQWLPDRGLRISQHGRHLDARRAQAP